MAGIQDSLDTYSKAYNENDADLLKTVVDQENVPFRRLVQTRFDTYQELIRAGTGTFNYKVDSITKRDLGFIQAHILSSGAALDWLFRYNGERWVISEPSEAQIGKRVKTESDAFIFLTYPWADNINPEIMKLMEQARETVKEKLGQAPDEKAEVLIKPIFSLPPPESANAWPTMRAVAGLVCQIVWSFLHPTPSPSVATIQSAAGMPILRKHLFTNMCI